MNNLELWSAYAADKTPMNQKKLVFAYINLVHYVIHHSDFSVKKVADEKNFFELGTKELNLFELGVKGLNEAIERYDYKLENAQRFETFAIQRIRGAIIDGIRSMMKKNKETLTPTSKGE